MPECLPPNKKPRVISNARLKNLNKPVQTMINSSPTLLPVSTSKGGVFRNFWTKSMQEMSHKLWLPTETDSLDLGSTCLNVSSENIQSHSTWFRVTHSCQLTKPKNFLKISSPFVTTSWPKTTAGEAIPQVEITPKGLLKIPDSKEKTKKIENIYCRKNKLNTKRLSDTNKLWKYFGTGRWCYNQAVSILQDKNYINLRKELVDDNNKSNSSIAWRKFIRALVIRMIAKAY